MEQANSYRSLKKLISFLEEIDKGYKPTEADLHKLAQIKIVGGPLQIEIRTLPKSIALLTNLQTLYLSDSQISNIDTLSSLPTLEALYLSRTQITNVDALHTLRNLTTLFINGSPITDIGALSCLTNLQVLDLSHTFVTNIDALSDLENLQMLSLSSTPLTNIDALSKLTNLQKLEIRNTPISNTTALSRLTKLHILDLRYSSIKDIDCLSLLTNLQVLDLSDTQIAKIDALATLKNLQRLYLSRTKIKNAEALAKHKNLRKLYLNNTQIVNLDCLSELTELQCLSIRGIRISNIDALASLQKLERFDLSFTKIRSIPHWISTLKNLKRLDLSGLHIHAIPSELLHLDIPFILDQPELYATGVMLANTTLATQPVSLFEQPRELIQAYYDALQVPVNEAKVIFLGDGGVGKTYTIKRIKNGGKKDNYSTKTTHGIEISTYPVEKDSRKFNIHFWDFGGQDIMHAMHRCFLTDRTCYVVVVSNRDDLNSRTRYWLKNIESFGHGAPVLLAVNMWDSIQECGLDMPRLTQEYPNLVKIPVLYSARDSSTTVFQLLIDSIIHQAELLDSSSMSFPIQWALIRQKLLEIAESRHYIDKKEYLQICNEQGLTSPKIRSWLLEWFNDLGICFSYHQDETDKTELTTYKVLNPSWLTNAIYIIINAGKQYAEKGRLNLKLMQILINHSEYSVLPGVTYSEDEWLYVLEVMRKFNLSYPVSDTQEFIPALCESSTPSDLHPTEYCKQISYQMKYTYLPDSVVHQLMIRCYKRLNPDKIWRKGLRIDYECFGLSAVVDMGNDDSTLQVDVYANGSVEPWKLLHNIRKDIVSINSNLGLKAEDYIIIHEESCDIPKTVNELLSAKEQGLNSLPVFNSFTRKWKSYLVDELLGMTLGNEIIEATVMKAHENNQSLTDAFNSLTVNIQLSNDNLQSHALDIIQTLIQHQCEANSILLDCLIDALNSTNDESAKKVAREITQDYKDNRNFLKRLEKYVSTTANVISGGKIIYEGATAIAQAINNAVPQIRKIFPGILAALQDLFS